MYSVIFSCVALVAAINTSQEHIHRGNPHSNGNVQATVLADGDVTQVMMRRENGTEREVVSERDDLRRSCECTDVDLGGKEYSPGGLKKCVGNCKKVYKATAPNDCPKNWKIFSPRNKKDWKTVLSVEDGALIKEVP
eukprot:Skav200761  [mRNA]  locus=scaffold2001:137548:141489:- [translate_table: standard]